MKNLKTIIYQGQEVRATLVNYLSETIPTSTVDRLGDEKLYRDEHGRYYLEQTLKWLTFDEKTGNGQREASGRTRVHRISLNAAILWATTRLNSETLHLRQDAAEVLQLADENSTDVCRVLDEHARGLLMEELSGAPGTDPRDVLNGAMDFLLADRRTNWLRVQVALSPPKLTA